MASSSLGNHGPLTCAGIALIVNGISSPITLTGLVSAKLKKFERLEEGTMISPEKTGDFKVTSPLCCGLMA